MNRYISLSIAYANQRSYLDGIMNNLLIKGDNIEGLNYLLENRKLKGKIDLVYIDPPFATKGDFTITEGRASTVSNSRNGDIAYSDRLTGRDFIEFLRERLILLKELLSEQGSIYLHIDYKIGHYVKVMMDEVFGIEKGLLSGRQLAIQER